jgi:hypothetical protein
MRNERLAAAQRIAALLIPHEQEIDDAIIRNARLTMAMVEGRRAAKAPLTLGQQSLELIARANASLLEARGHVAKAHLELRDAQFALGLGAVSYGDYGQTPTEPAARAPLSVVQAA